MAKPIAQRSLKGPKPQRLLSLHIPKANEVHTWPFLKNLQVGVLVSSLLLVIYGCVVVASASLTISEASLPRQLLGVLIGLIAAFFMWRYDYRGLAQFSEALLVIDIILFVLPMIPVLGYSAHGMTGWVQIPGIPFRFQPSEIMKLVTIFYIASLCAKHTNGIETLEQYIKLCVYLAIPFVLLLSQDLGTSLVVLVSGACVIAYAGPKKEWVVATVLILCLFAAVIVVTSMIPNVPHFLKDYQLKRLLVFTNPSIDPTGDGYNLQQATIAVGSGGFFGKGIGMATQAGQGFLPEAHTDFVFALLAEQFGFVGASILIALYAWLIISTINLAKQTESAFGKLVLVGITSMWLFQVFENIGMCIGIMPITGIPLPFISYGASSMVIQILAVGIVQSVYRHRVKAS